MATTVKIETNKQPPPKGSSRLHRLESNIQAVIQEALGDSSVTVSIVQRKGSR